MSTFFFVFVVVFLLFWQANKYIYIIIIIIYTLYRCKRLEKAYEVALDIQARDLFMVSLLFLDETYEFVLIIAGCALSCCWAKWIWIGWKGKTECRRPSFSWVRYIHNKCVFYSLTGEIPLLVTISLFYVQQLTLRWHGWDVRDKILTSHPVLLLLFILYQETVRRDLIILPTRLSQMTASDMPWRASVFSHSPLTL